MLGGDGGGGSGDSAGVHYGPIVRGGGDGGGGVSAEVSHSEAAARRILLGGTPTRPGHGPRPGRYNRKLCIPIPTS